MYGIENTSTESMQDVFNSGDYNKLLDGNKHMHFNMDLV